MKTVEEQLEEISGNAVRDVDKKQVIARLEKLSNDKKEKTDRMQQLKEGRAFIAENADSITIYKFISHKDNIGIAIGCHDLDGQGKIFNLACSHCSQGDMKKNKWSDRIARGIIGAELKKEWDKSGWERSMLFFEKKTDPVKAINYLFMLKVADIIRESTVLKNCMIQDRVGGPFANLFSAKIDCGRSSRKQVSVVPVDKFKCSRCKYSTVMGELCSISTEINDLSDRMRDIIRYKQGYRVSKYYSSLGSLYIKVPGVYDNPIFACAGKVENLIDNNFEVEFCDLPRCEDCDGWTYCGLKYDGGCCVRFKSNIKSVRYNSDSIDPDKKEKEPIVLSDEDISKAENDISTKPLVHEKICCTRCNVLNSIDSIFCNKCGSRILQEEIK
jgi:ribosomal protein L40E